MIGKKLIFLIILVILLGSVLAPSINSQSIQKTQLSKNSKKIQIQYMFNSKSQFKSSLNTNKYRDMSGALASVSDEQNNLYIAGTSNENSKNHKFMDAIIIKYDSDGNKIWSETWQPDEWGINYNSRIQGIAIYQEYIYAVGYVVVSPSNLIRGADFFIIKYDLDGNLIWEKLIKENLEEFPIDVICYNNFIYVLSNLQSVMQLKSSQVIRKLDLEGNLIKTETWDDYHFTSATSLEIYDNIIYVTGGIVVDMEILDYDLYILKYDLDLEKKDTITWAGNPDDDTKYAVGYSIVAYNDYLYVLSQTNWGEMIHILKFDLDGNLFVKSDWYILDPELDFGSISPFEIIQAHGSLYVVGMKIIQNDPEIAAEISGIFAKYNPENCEKEWNIWVTDYDNIIINSVTESDNGVYICGNIAINQMTVESTIVVGKYNSDGNQQWFKKYEWDNSKPAFKIDYLVNLRNIFNSILKIYFHKL